MKDTMPALKITVHSTLSREQFLAALIDFGPTRGHVWSNSQPSHLEVHRLDQYGAEVTEGSRILGGAWERLRYDWSSSDVITLHTVDSNIWAAGSGWRYEFKERQDQGPGSIITATVTRYPNSLKGRFIIIIFGSIGRPLITNGFRQTINKIESRHAN